MFYISQRCVCRSSSTQSFCAVSIGDIRISYWYSYWYWGRIQDDSQFLFSATFVKQFDAFSPNQVAGDTALPKRWWNQQLLRTSLRPEVAIWIHGPFSILIQVMARQIILRLDINQKQYWILLIELLWISFNEILIPINKFHSSSNPVFQNNICISVEISTNTVCCQWWINMGFDDGFVENRLQGNI